MTPLFATLGLKAVTIWLVLPGVAYAGGAGDLHLAQEAFVPAVIGLLVLVEIRRRNEHLFLPNLGIPSASAVLASLVIPSILEVLVP